MELGDHWHGKAQVRVAKVFRDPIAHRFVEYSVELILHGGTSASFMSGDNSRVVATDTCKNHVYLLAKDHTFQSPEQFAIDLVQRMLREYPWLTGTRAKVTEKGWRRLSLDGSEHVHGFERREEKRSGMAEMARGGKVIVTSSLEDVAVLKTTKSGWAGFWMDWYTTLPETTERILASIVAAHWRHDKLPDAATPVQYEKVAERVRGALMAAFYGDADKGIYSKGVQETLYKMATAAMQAADIEWVKISMPNLHFLPCNIPVFQKAGIKFQDDLYVPTDEPHGIIAATVQRQRSKL